MRITGTLHEDQFTFLIISRSVTVRMRNTSQRNCKESQNTHFILNNFFLKKNCVIYEVMWKNILDLERPQITI